MQIYGLFGPSKSWSWQWKSSQDFNYHYSDVIMGAMASQITSLTIVYWTVYSEADQRKHQSSASLAFVRGIHRWPTQMASSAENVSIWWRHHGAHKSSVKWVPVGPGVLRWCSVVDGWLRVNSHSTLLTLRDTLNGLSGISWLWPECWLS